MLQIRAPSTSLVGFFYILCLNFRVIHHTSSEASDSSVTYCHITSLQLKIKIKHLHWLQSGQLAPGHCRINSHKFGVPPLSSAVQYCPIIFFSLPLYL